MSIALGWWAAPSLSEPFPLQGRQLLSRLPLVHRELVLDHLLREGLVPGAAANPVLARAHDVDAAALACGRGGRGRTACGLPRPASRRRTRLARRPRFPPPPPTPHGARRTGPSPGAIPTRA